MRGFVHHLGDWALATGHLPLLERGAYHALIEAYYAREGPLPASVKDCCVIVGAFMPHERRAVERVIKQFFSIGNDGQLHQKRCDVEITKDRARRTQKSNAAKTRWGTQSAMRNSRELLASTKMGPDLDKLNGYKDARTLPGTSTNVGERIEDAQRIAHAMQPNMHNPSVNTNTKKGAETLTEKAAQDAAVSARNSGFKIDSQNPQLLAMLAGGITVAEIADAAARGACQGKPWAWVVAAAVGRHAEPVASFRPGGNASRTDQNGAGSPNYPMLPRWHDPH
jgi:uncharacterized protein YdaU (DUF1376 family)